MPMSTGSPPSAQPASTGLGTAPHGTTPHGTTDTTAPPGTTPPTKTGAFTSSLLQTPDPNHYYGRVIIAESARWTRVAADIAEAIVQPLTRAKGARIEVTIEVDATASSGFDESVQADITENAVTLKFDESDFTVQE